MFRYIDTPEEFEEFKVMIEKDEKLKSRLMKIQILDVVKLVVGTTNEIPIDLKCLIYRSDKDFDRVREIVEEANELLEEQAETLPPVDVVK